MASYTLTGTGIQSLTLGLTRLFISVTIRSARWSTGFANPPNLYHIGLLRLQVSGASYPAIPIDADLMALDVPSGTTSIGYELVAPAEIVIYENALPSSGEFGYHHVATDGTDSISNNYVWVKAANVPAGSGTVNGIYVYGAGADPTDSVLVGIYTDSAGIPDALVGAGASPLVATSTFAWYSTTASIPITAGTQYWFALCWADTASNLYVNFDNNAGAAELYYLYSAGVFALPGSAAGATGVTGERWSVYATYT